MTGQLSLFPEEAAPESLLCWLWLAEVLGAAHPAAARLIDRFGDAVTAWQMRSSEEFRLLAGQAASLRALDADLTPESFRPLVQRCEKAGIRILTYDDFDYPTALAALPDLPPVLYASGDVAVLNEEATVGMVGSRKPTPYGILAASAIGKGLAEAGAILVSGLADGLDSEAHRASLAAHRPTLAVLGVPIDRTYPASNAALRHQIEGCGCVISEYPPAKQVGKVGFLQRNRLIAGLSRALLVVEAKEKSGTMSTVAHAERYGRQVFAVPGSIFSASSSGTNHLIRFGRAKAAVCPDDILPVLGLEGAAAAPAEPEALPPLSPEQRRLLDCIGAEPKGLEQLSAESGLPAASLLGALMQLCLSGRILELPGKRYLLC